MADRVGGDGGPPQAQRLPVDEGAARDPDGHADALELEKVPVVDEAEYETHADVSAAVEYGVRLNAQKWRWFPDWPTNFDISRMIEIAKVSNLPM